MGYFLVSVWWLGCGGEGGLTGGGIVLPEIYGDHNHVYISIYHIWMTGMWSGAAVYLQTAT
ncbi:hypothetical protein DFP73DRAFT_535433, partial [Morchella snyderi]